MKRKSILVCTALIIAFSLLVSCNGETPVKEYTVSFDSNGGTEVESVLVKAGEKAAAPENPSRMDYIFVEWLLGEEPFDFENTAIEKDIELTASWKFDGTEVADGESFISALSESGKIKLASDIVLSSTAAVKDADIMIDLAGYKITPADGFAKNGGLFLIDNSGKLTVKDSVGTGTIDVTKGETENFSVWACFVVYPDSGYKAELVIEGGTYIAPSYPISGNGNCTEEGCTNIVINGGVFKSLEGLAIYHPQNGTLSVNGGEFHGQESAIEIRAGKLIITEGIFDASNKPAYSAPNGNGTTSNGVAIAVAQHTTKLPISVKISGGRFSGYSALYESNPQNNSDPDISLEVTGGEFSCINEGTVAVYSEDCTAFIKGGSYSSEPAAAYIAEGYGAVESEGIYKVLPSNAE